MALRPERAGLGLLTVLTVIPAPVLAGRAHVELPSGQRLEAAKERFDADSRTLVLRLEHGSRAA